MMSEERPELSRKWPISGKLTLSNAKRVPEYLGEWSRDSEIIGSDVLAVLLVKLDEHPELPLKWRISGYTL